jgi:hypothetical protein
LKGKRLALIAAAALAVLAAAGAAYATTSSGAYSACEGKQGTIRLVGATARCKPGEHKITFGADGLSGPTGPQGADGARGPNGPRGANGQNGAPGLIGATGPQGVTGATGTAGAPGQTGATGPRGSTPTLNIQDVTATTATSGSGIYTAKAPCPAGWQLTGGGGYAPPTIELGELSGIQLIVSYPDGNAWEAIYNVPDSGRYTVEAYAVCAQLSP